MDSEDEELHSPSLKLIYMVLDAAENDDEAICKSDGSMNELYCSCYTDLSAEDTIMFRLEIRAIPAGDLMTTDHDEMGETTERHGSSDS